MSGQSAEENVPGRDDDTVVPDPTSPSADPSSSGTAGQDRGPRRIERSVPELEEEGEIAADYLEGLLDIVDLDGDIDIVVRNGRAHVSVVAQSTDEQSDLEMLVGEEGEVLEALQDLTRLAVQARTGERTRLMLDIAGHRSTRRLQVEKIAREAVERVESTGEPFALGPMTPYERKIVHDVVATAGLDSGSEGEDRARHVVVHPAH